MLGGMNAFILISTVFFTTTNLLFADGFNVPIGTTKIAGLFRRAGSSSLDMKQQGFDAIRDLISHGNYGTEWSFLDLTTNLKKNNVDFASILDNANLIVAVDSKHTDIISGENLHYIKTIPQLTSKIIELFNDNHIHFNILSFNNGNSIGAIAMSAFNMITGYLLFIMGINFLRNIFLRNSMSRPTPNNNNNNNNGGMVFSIDL